MVFFEHTVIDENKVIFEAIEDGKVLGKCKLNINTNALVSDVTYEKSSVFVVEGLLKAAFYYAGLRGVFWGICTDESIDFLLRKLNFEKTPSGYENDIPTILQGSCGNCINNA